MEIKIGTNFILEPTEKDATEKFRCKLAEQQGDTLFIDYPVNVATKKTAFLLDGTQLSATFQTESRETFVFYTEVLGRKPGNIPMIMLHCPPDEDFIKIQRRQYVRVETPVDIAVKYEGQYYQYVTQDISAGGIALKLNNRMVPFKEQDSIELIMVLPFSNGDMHYVTAEAHVVRIFEREALKIASIQFADIAELYKQLIVRFCFDRQLQIRKKETNILS